MSTSLLSTTKKKKGVEEERKKEEKKKKKKKERKREEKKWAVGVKSTKWERLTQDWVATDGFLHERYAQLYSKFGRVSDPNSNKKRDKWVAAHMSPFIKKLRDRFPPAPTTLPPSSKDKTIDSAKDKLVWKQTLEFPVPYFAQMRSVHARRLPPMSILSLDVEIYAICHDVVSVAEEFDDDDQDEEEEEEEPVDFFYHLSKLLVKKFPVKNESETQQKRVKMLSGLRWTISLRLPVELQPLIKETRDLFAACCSDSKKEVVDLDTASSLRICQARHLVYSRILSATLLALRPDAPTVWRNLVVPFVRRHPTTTSTIRTATEDVASLTLWYWKPNGDRTPSISDMNRWTSVLAAIPGVFAIVYSSISSSPACTSPSVVSPIVTRTRIEKVIGALLTRMTKTGEDSERQDWILQCPPSIMPRALSSLFLPSSVLTSLSSLSSSPSSITTFGTATPLEKFIVLEFLLQWISVPPLTREMTRNVRIHQAKWATASQQWRTCFRPKLPMDGNGTTVHLSQWTWYTGLQLQTLTYCIARWRQTLLARDAIYTLTSATESTFSRYYNSRRSSPSLPVCPSCTNFCNHFIHSQYSLFFHEMFKSPDLHFKCFKCQKGNIEIQTDNYHKWNILKWSWAWTINRNDYETFLREKESPRSMSDIRIDDNLPPLLNDILHYARHVSSLVSTGHAETTYGDRKDEKGGGGGADSHRRGRIVRDWDGEETNSSNDEEDSHNDEEDSDNDSERCVSTTNTPHHQIEQVIEILGRLSRQGLLRPFEEKTGAYPYEVVVRTLDPQSVTQRFGYFSIYLLIHLDAVVGPTATQLASLIRDLEPLAPRVWRFLDPFFAYYGAYWTRVVDPFVSKKEQKDSLTK